MYLPVSLVGALVYGASLGDVVIFSIQVRFTIPHHHRSITIMFISQKHDIFQTAWIQQAVNMLITVHVFLALTIVFNPINQEAEQFFNVPERQFDTCITLDRILSNLMQASNCSILVPKNHRPCGYSVPRSPLRPHRAQLW